MALTLLSPVSRAQTVDEMRVELKRLREEINELRLQRPADWASKATDSARIEPPTAPPNAPVAALPVSTGTAFHVYGTAEAHAIHDFKQSGSPDLFSDLTFQPLDKAGSQKGRTKLTAETSRFGIETSTPAGAGAVTTMVEVDFYSYTADNRNIVRLRQAYGEYGGWLVGQTWSTFMDLDDLPETIDFNGPIGAPFSRRPMIRYSFSDATTGIKFSVAAEDPDDQSGGGSANERLPQLVARADKEFSWGAVNVRALAHEKRSFSQTRRGFGIAIGGHYKLSEKDLLMAQYTRVDGDVDQLYGSNGYLIDATTGKITFDRNQGLVLGWERTYSAKLRGNVVLGINRGHTVQAVDNKSMGQVFFNLIYSPLKNVEFGGELIYGRRKTFDGDVGTLSRLDLMGRYSF